MPQTISSSRSESASSSRPSAGRGELFIVSAPSGAGKTTLIQSILERGLGAGGAMEFSVSYTTRKPRRGEVEGRDYHFTSVEDFESMIGEGRFLEWARVHENYYGTSRAEVLPRLEAGVDVLLDIDVQGAEQVFQNFSEAVGIFILPPSFAVLAERLRGRGLDDEAEIDRRLAVARDEMRAHRHYAYVIINDDAAEASEAMASIIRAYRHRHRRMKPFVEGVMARFRREDPQAGSTAGESVTADQTGQGE